MSKDAQVIVIGGGVIGVCVAHYLQNEGIDVAIVEKNDIGKGCSYGNAGYACPSHFVPLASPGILAKGIRWMLDPKSPFYVKPRLDRDLASWLLKFRASCSPTIANRAKPLLRDLNVASVELFKGLTGLDSIEFGFETRGILMLYNSEKGEREESELAREAEMLGVEARVLTAQQINELDPGIRTCARGGVYYPGDCHMDPGRFVESLFRYLEGKGLKTFPSREVLGFERHNGRITAVRTSHGPLSAEEFILAGGAWSPRLCRDLGIRLPVQPAKGYSVTIDDPPRKMKIPSILMESKVAITPIGERLRFAGTLELAGLDLSINRRRVDAILNAVPRYLSGINPDSYRKIQPWAGLRPCSPDGLPFVGRFTAYPNLIAATGHAMLGLSLAPITGKLVAELLARKKTSIDIALLQPDRFD